MKSSIERYTECSYADPLGMNGTGFVQMNVRFKVQLDLLSKQRYLFDLWQGGGGRKGGVGGQKTCQQDTACFAL